MIRVGWVRSRESDGEDAHQVARDGARDSTAGSIRSKLFDFLTITMKPPVWTKRSVERSISYSCILT